MGCFPGKITFEGIFPSLLPLQNLENTFITGSINFKENKHGKDTRTLSWKFS